MKNGGHRRWKNKNYSICNFFFSSYLDYSFLYFQNAWVIILRNLAKIFELKFFEVEERKRTMTSHVMYDMTRVLSEIVIHQPEIPRKYSLELLENLQVNKPFWAFSIKFLSGLIFQRLSKWNWDAQSPADSIWHVREKIKFCLIASILRKDKKELRRENDSKSMAVVFVWIWRA